jgi:hypothetical protein
MRRAVEVAFELKSGGEVGLGQWMWQQKSQGASLRAIADRLTVVTGVQVSHETIRTWMKEG